ncbi:hypothetical protein ACI780_03610 [Geodermatophilus sp. SYSU D00814]
MASPADVGVPAAEPATGTAPRAGSPRTVVQLRVDREALVPAVAAALVAVHLLLRAWTAAGGWLTRQDLLAPASLIGLTGEVPGPPAAAALARGVASVAPYSWPGLVALEVAGQLLVDLLLYRLLVDLAGRRPAVLLPFTVYLTSSLPLVGGLWWSAALVQLPLQLVLLTAVGAHVRHLRTRAPGPAVVAGLAVAGGLLFAGWVALVPLLLLAGTLAWATAGPLRERVRALARWRTAWAAQAAGVFAGLLARALTDAGPLLDPTRLHAAAGAAPGELARTVLPGLVGGPWGWRPVALPFAVPEPPPALVWGAGAVVAAVVVGSVVLARGALRAWLLAAAAGAVVLLAEGAAPDRADVTGGLPAGTVAPATLALLAALGLTLAVLPVVGAPPVLRRRRAAGLPARLARPALGVAVGGALAVGCVLSTAGFASFWSVNATRDYVAEARASVIGRQDLVVADTTVPEEVVPGALAPANRASVVLSGLPAQPHFLQVGEVTHQLAALDDRGRGQLAAVDPVTTSGPGPQPDCGWQVAGAPVTVPLRQAVPPGRWIVQVAYIAGGANAVTVQAGDTLGGRLVGAGLRDLYLQVDGAVDELVVAVDDPGVPVCVGVATVGTPRPLTPGGG